MEKRCGCDCNVASHARADEYQITGELLAEVNQLRDTGTRHIDAAIIHGVRLVALATRDFGQCRDLPSPWATFLAMGEDNVTTDYRRFHNNSSRLMAASLTTL